jgi:serine/threonine-protein kinase
MAFEVGQLLGARFRLVNRIGEGALGELWRGTDRIPTKQVAIRLLTPKTPVAKGALDTFLAETRTACQLRHRSAGRVVEVGHTDGGVPWIATELLRGETLEDLLARRNAISPGAALHLISDLAEVLSEAHGLGLVHRGIHPRSIMLHREDDGSVAVKLVDFGREQLIASTKGEGATTQGYRSVELALGARATKESDVWALGVLLFRSVAGRLPFTMLSEVATGGGIEQILEEGIEDPAVLRIARDCLRPARAQRISAAELADRAQLAGWTTRGGWSEVEKMVRVPETLLDTEQFGRIEHTQTIPGIVGAQAAIRTPVLPTPASTSGELAPIQAVERVPVSEPPIVSEPPVAISLSRRPQYEGVLDVWSPRRKRVVAAMIAASAAIGAIAGAASRPPPARHVHAAAPRAVAVRNDAPAKPREVVTPVAMTTTVSTPTPAVASIAPPSVATAPVASTTAKTEPTKPVAPKAPKPTLGSDPFATHPAIPGVPLWDPPKVEKPAVDDNPYQ